MFDTEQPPMKPESKPKEKKLKLDSKDINSQNSFKNSQNFDS